MEIKKIETIKVMTTNGLEVAKGDKVIWTNKNGECMCGVYDGLDHRNNMVIKSAIEEDVEFHIMPKSIVSLYIANIETI